MLDTNGIPVAAPGLIWRNLDDGVVLVTPKSGNVRVLNGVGGAIWQLINGRNTIADMHGYLAAQYEVSSEQAANDVQHFLTELAQRHLITWAEKQDDGQ
jgi:hypothetical protein